MNIRGRLALLIAVLFGFLMAGTVKQSFSPYSWAPMFIGLFSFILARIFFWIVFLVWDIVVYGKNKFAKK
jgi:hypothetical protein